MDWSSIGRNLRQYRQESGLRQEDLARAAGLSVNYIGMVERGEKIPSLETFVAMLNLLLCVIDWSTIVLLNVL